MDKSDALIERTHRPYFPGDAGTISSEKLKKQLFSDECIGPVTEEEQVDCKDRNKCLTGILIALPLSLLAWAGLYWLFKTLTTP